MDSRRWVNKHEDYSKQDWVTKPSIFAKQAFEYFPKSGRILELGAGHGQDGIYFASRGFDVLSTDLEITSLTKNVSDTRADISIERLDLEQPFHFASEQFDVIYAHLALHYFDQETTKRIFEDIYRVLKPNGILAFLVNSVDDPEYRTGTKIEGNLFEIDGARKRFFNAEDAKTFARKFNIILVDNNGDTYKDTAKGVHNLIRLIGKKN